MSVIEQAAKRLAELRKAGITTDALTTARVTDSAPTPAGLAQEALEADVMVKPVVSPKVAVADRPTAARVSTVTSKRVSISFARLAELGLVSPEDARSQVAEEFRLVKRPLIRNVTGNVAAQINNANLVMVTSALPGEGKTNSAVNLAISIAMELDRTVLLVDADVAKPSVPTLLGLPLERGLLDILLDDKLDLSDVLLKTNIEKLSLLPSGTAHPRATELLASDAMSRLLGEIAGRYADRIVIFDSPPLLLTTEARVLAAHMGQILVVVEAEKTTHTALTQALAMIEACPVKLLMLNKSRLAGAGRYYGYGRFEGYGYGG